MIQSQLTHVAFLVRSLADSARTIESHRLKPNPFEEFEHEGTSECYFGPDDQSARLLMVEAILDGPYRRALLKRGPGLHHLGVDVVDLEAYAEQLASAGWLLHPKSLTTIAKQRTAYFARPQTPFLVEARETRTAGDRKPP